MPPNTPHACQDCGTLYATAPRPTTCTECGGDIVNTSSFREKWGWSSGFAMIPDEIPEYAGLLGIGKPAVRYAVVSVLLKYWWYADTLPHPSYETIAKHLGYGKGEIRKTLNALCADGLLEKVEKVGQRGQNGYSLDGLKRLIKIIRENVDDKHHLTPEGHALVLDERERLRRGAVRAGVVTSSERVRGAPL